MSEIEKTNALGKVSARENHKERPLYMGIIKGTGLPCSLHSSIHAYKNRIHTLEDYIGIMTKRGRKGQRYLEVLKDYEREARALIETGFKRKPKDRMEKRVLSTRIIRTSGLPETLHCSIASLVDIRGLKTYKEYLNIKKKSKDLIMLSLLLDYKLEAIKFIRELNKRKIVRPSRNNNNVCNTPYEYKPRRW